MACSQHDAATSDELKIESSKRGQGRKENDGQNKLARDM